MHLLTCVINFKMEIINLSFIWELFGVSNLIHWYLRRSWWPLLIFCSQGQRSSVKICLIWEYCPLINFLILCYLENPLLESHQAWASLFYPLKIRWHPSTCIGLLMLFSISQILNLIWSFVKNYLPKKEQFYIHY